VVCPSCNALASHERGELALVSKLKKRHQPALPLGARGKLFGHPLEVIGWTRRAVTVAGVDYRWEEYLLHGERGYAFLSENKGHWTYFTQLPLAALSEVSARAARYREQRYDHFQRSNDVRYIDVQGEFYWEIKPEQRSHMDDYVCPPYQLSVEHTGKEQIWTYGVYVPADELWQSFGQTSSPPRQEGVGPCQPNPYKRHKRGMLMGLGIGSALFVLFTVALLVTQPKRTRLIHHVALADDQPVSLSDPFELRGHTQAVAVGAHADFDVGNGWMALDVSLIEEATGRSNDWVEDGRHTEQRLGAIKPGRYVLRVEPHYDPQYSRPSVLRLEVAQGAFLWLPLCLCLLALHVPPLFWAILMSRFEGRRWSESDHADSDDDDDDDDE
jgi:hypothetical protein